MKRKRLQQDWLGRFAEGRGDERQDWICWLIASLVPAGPWWFLAARSAISGHLAVTLWLFLAGIAFYLLSMAQALTWGARSLEMLLVPVIVSILALTLMPVFMKVFSHHVFPH